MSVLVVGDVITDTVVNLAAPMQPGGDAEASITDTLGGQGANVARWLVVAGVTDVRLFGARSTHDVVDYSAALRATGVTAELIPFDAPAPRIVVIVDPHGTERSFLTQRGAASLLAETHAQAVDLDGVQWCHVSGYVLASASGREFYACLQTRCREKNIAISVDPSSISEILRHGAEEFLRLIGPVALLIPNEAEASALSGRSNSHEAAQILAHCADTVVVKRGAAGAVAVTKRAHLVTVPAQPADVVDPTGAGDAFCAGLISALIGGAPLPDALIRGSEFGAKAVEIRGAYQSTA
jgi:sugar/nucleoside kinase (ribokinase family)